MIEYNRIDNVEKCLEGLSRFIHCWYGIGKCMDDNFSSEVNVPFALQYIYRNYERSFNRIITYNRFIESRKLNIKDNGVIFYIESEGAFVWQYQYIGNDVKVFISENREPHKWLLEEEALCGFLFQVLVYEAMMSSKYHCMTSWIDIAKLDKILSQWKPVPLLPWQWPAHPAKFYQKENALAFVYPNQDSFTFQSGSNDPLSLKFLKPYIDGTWEDNHIE